MTPPAGFNVVDYGAVPDGTTDCAPAFEAALAAVAAQPGGPVVPSQSLGGRVRVPAGKYRLSRTLRLGRGLVLEGDSGSGYYGGSWLLFDPDVPGVVVDRYNSGGSGAGDWSVVRGLCLEGSGTANPLAHGVQLYARAKVADVFVRGFAGHGVCIDTSLTPNGAQNINANNWRLEYLRADLCGGHGVYVRGQDANAGIATGVDCSENKGWGFYDSSFLGNAYAGCHAAGNGLGGYKADGQVAHNVFVGCYCEGGQPPNQLAAPALVLGGILAQMPNAPPDGRPSAILLDSEGDGLHLTGGIRSVMTAANGAQVNAWFAHPGSAPIPFAFGSSDEPAGALAYSLQYAAARKVWDWLYASSRPLLEFAPDYPAFPVGYRNGQGAFGRVVRAGDGPPTSGAWQAGDRVEALHPAAGGWLGWVCVQTGTPGAWRTYGPISA